MDSLVKREKVDVWFFKNQYYNDLATRRKVGRYGSGSIAIGPSIGARVSSTLGSTRSECRCHRRGRKSLELSSRSSSAMKVIVVVL